MKYFDILQKGQINAGTQYKNLSSLKRDLIRTEACSDIHFIGVAKRIFDANLPNDYSKLTNSLGMCFYWAEMYRRLFSDLGYYARVMRVFYPYSGITPFVWVRVKTSCDDDVIIDIDRDSCASAMLLCTDYEKRIRNMYISDAFKCHDKCVIEELEDYDLWSISSRASEYKLADLPQGVLTTLNQYIDQLLNGDVDTYNFKPLVSEFDGFKLMYLYVTDSKASRNIKYLKDEINSRKKYNIPLYH